MRFVRHFTKPNLPIEDQITWKKAESLIKKANGDIVFQMQDIEVPSHWSQQAINILAQKYFRKAGVPDLTIQHHNDKTIPLWLSPSQSSGTGIFGSETSAKQVFHRLAGTWTYFGWKEGIFGKQTTPEYSNFSKEMEENARIFYDETYFMLAHQFAAPNSPQWFNTGLFWAYGITGDASGQWVCDENGPRLTTNSYEHPQPHACQPSWSLVSTRRGLVPISELILGEEIYDRNGVTRITAKVNNGHKEVFRVEISNGNYIEATENHKVLVCPQYNHNQKNNPYLCWMNISELRPGMRLLQRNDLVIDKPTNLETDEALLVGFLQGDGYQSRSQYSSPCIEFMSINDEEYTTLIDAIEYVFKGIHYNISDVDNSSDLDIKRIRLYGKDLLSFLNKYELTDNRWAENMRIPNLILSGGHSVACAYLQGFFQAEGCVRIKGTSSDITLVSISKFLLEDIQHLLLNLGIFSRLMPSYEKREDRKPCYSLVIAYKSEREKFSSIIDFISTEKCQKLVRTLSLPGKNIPSSRLEEITEIRSIGDYVVWDIETESHNYLTNSIVVHNCFIQPISDNLVEKNGIFDLLHKEALLFKHGSGTGTNFSPLRSNIEQLSGGGKSSGMMSFLKIFDSAAGAIQSGGTTRRAAKMICLDMDHPEVEEFISWKMKEERKARALVLGSQALNDGGEIYSDEFEGEAINTVSAQNANNSLRITNKFLDCIDGDHNWQLTARTTGKIVKTVRAKELWNQIIHAAWSCADPGLQFHDTINEWHTCKTDGNINASNPCCFVGSTLIDTSEGLIPISKLEEACTHGKQLPYAFSFDRNSALPKLKPILNAWVAGYTKTLVDVYLDNGEVFRCTPEHKFLLRNGEYIEAQKLYYGASLRKIGRFTNRNRSDRCSILHRCTENVPNGTQYQSRWMWEQINGPIPEGLEIHHLNDDATDDRISNFELKPILDHRIEHSTGKKNPRYLKVDDSLLVEIYDAVWNMPRQTHFGKNPVTVARWNYFIRKENLVGKIPLARGDGRIQGMSWKEFLSRIELARETVNAKVLQVQKINLEEPEAVYDLEVKDTHNFAIRANESRNEPAIIVSNSEYMFLDNTACNLASLNLGKFLKNSEFQINDFEYATRIWTIILEISVYMASFPSKEIAENSYAYRTLGLGYMNLGGLLMRKGFGYDSDEGRDLAGSITALMHSISYLTSQEMALELGPFPRWEANKVSMSEVIKNHIEYLRSSKEIWKSACKAFVKIDPNLGFRNAQVTLQAPTGTIHLVTDCDTSGIEPDFSLIKFKQLAGGGMMKIVNECLPEALDNLGYTPAQIMSMRQHIEEHGNLENYLINGKNLPESHLKVFDCANISGNGKRYLSALSHVKMMAAIQPFLSGAISKTCNLPNHATLEDVDFIYREANRLGLKAIAIYRDGCKMTQPLSSKKEEKKETILGSVFDTAPGLVKAPSFLEQSQTSDRFFSELLTPQRTQLPMRRKGYRQKVQIDGQSVYLSTGEYDDGRLGEIWIEISREGSTVRALLGSFSKAISVGLQYGVPLSKFINAFVYTKFEPAGIVQGHDRIKTTTSVLDFIFRELAINYLNQTEFANVTQEEPDQEVFLDLDTLKTPNFIPIPKEALKEEILAHSKSLNFTGNICPNCGHNTLRQTGTCVTCTTCNSNTGCG